MRPEPVCGRLYCQPTADLSSGEPLSQLRPTLHCIALGSFTLRRGTKQ